MKNLKRSTGPKKTKPVKPAKKTDTSDGGQSKEKERNGYKLGLNPPGNVIVYWDKRDGSYWHHLNGQFIAMGKSDLKMQMRGIGLSDWIMFDGQLETDWPLWRAQMERMVDYAGPMAGHRVGAFKDGGQRCYLVTDEPHGIFTPATAKGVPEFFSAFIKELLPQGQWSDFCFWLAIALQSMLDGDFRPGQFVVLAGEHQCGKSLLQYIVTEILGGRAANPFEYLMGEEKFNRDLVGAEHWLIEDPRGSIDMRTRRDFGARLKEATVNRDIRIRAMNKDGVLVKIFRRITISVNLELEYLSVLPPFDPSINDKGFLFLCSTVKEAFAPFRNGDDLSREKIWSKVMSEIPKIRAWLLKAFAVKNIPPDSRDDRFGIAAWQHPQLISELTSLSHEARLLELIDEMEFPKFDKDGKRNTFGAVDALCDITSSEVQKRLLDHNRFEAEKILKYAGACGSHLGKLARSHKDRVSKKVNTGKTFWTIQPPAQEKENDNGN